MRWALAAAMVLWAGCAEGEHRQACTSVAECLRTESCVDGLCQPKDAGAASMDAGTGEEDAGAVIDAGMGVDTGEPGGDAGAQADAGPPEIDAGPSCTDDVANGDETDVDCGGSCLPCDECGACAADTDCARGRCSTGGLCQLRQEIYVDWLAHCSTDGSAGLDVPGLPAGDYTVTALDSAATVWDPPYSPPTNGWFYRVPCAGISVPDVATPSSTYFADAASAFAGLVATSETTTFAGGTLRCEVRDSACTDNHGGVRFAIERACP